MKTALLKSSVLAGLITIGGLLSGSYPAYAVSFGPCPSASGANAGAAYLAAGALCNVVITFAADGSVSTAISNPNPYDGSEDTLVGVVNNSSSVVTSISLSSTLALFGFDGDGICSGLFGVSGATNCPHGTSTANGNDYLGQASSFSNISANQQSGVVNFPGIAANGGTAFFSLEEAPSVTLVAGPGPGRVPFPSTLFLLGAGFLGLAGIVRRKHRVA
jgi:hypothetical protein